MNSTFLTKKIIIAIIGVVALAGILIGAYFFYSQSQTKSLGQITYGYQNWPGVLPYLVANDKGFFKEEGLDVKMVKVDSYVKEIEDLNSGQVDFIGDIALIDVVKQVSQGKDLKIVLATDYSNGADGIVAKKEIKTVLDLKGKKVAVEKGTLGEYLLFDALKKNSLGLSELSLVELSAQEAAQAFISGEVDAAVTYEPDFSQAVDKGNGWRLYTSSDSPGLIIDVLTFKKGFILQNEDKVQAVVAAYAKAMDFIKANSEEAYAVGAKYFAITPAEFKEQLAGIKLMDKFENNAALSYKISLDSLHGSVIEANTFLLGSGAIKNKVDSLDVIDASFLRGLEE
ncbi:MAG: aliphatic sulfonate ABC transporter substrate-binding protein [Candidatus Paceibacterota bacterium]